MEKIKKWLKYKMCKWFSFSYVLMFHHITEMPKVKKSACLLSFDFFKNFILRYNGNYSSFEDVAAKKVKRKIAVTFDDGLEDVYTMAYPFLKEHNVPFTIFVITDFLDTDGYITTEQLKEMSKDPLVTIGSHGVTHKILPKLSREEKMFELSESKRKLSELIGKDVTVFAYSHGQFDQETLSLMGCYDYAFSAGECFSALLKWDKYLIPRFNLVSKLYDNQIAFFDKVIKK